MHANLFFSKSPAFYYGIAFLIGTLGAIQQNWLLILPLGLLTYADYKRAFLGSIFALAGFIFALNSYHYVTVESKNISGIADVQLERLILQKNRFGQFWHYYGTMRAFSPDEKNLLSKVPQNVPVTFKIKKNENWKRPQADGRYLIACNLVSSPGKRYILKTKRDSWEKVPFSFSLGEVRYLAKKNVGNYIKSCFKDKNVQDFLSGLITGEFNEKKLKDAFSRFGLLHLMAISGFHFSLIAFIFDFLLRPFFAPLKRALVITIALTIYFIFLGNGPSILRAWLTIIISYSALFNKRLSNSLNSLGIALIVSLVLNPGICTHIGFQFSFLVTAAILLLFHPAEKSLLSFFPRRTSMALPLFSFIDKHVLIILGFFRPILALNLVTTVAALPLSLYYFQRFPLLGIIYNLYFPLFVIVSLFLLISGLLFSPFPLIGTLIHYFNNLFTNFILNMTLDVPKPLDINLISDTISENLVIVYYCVFFTLGIYIHIKNKKFIDNLN
ncbi:Uncharacterized protein PHSC3_001204 [Chlamydiales bacterium STE3]|nr:Uncharacterized protein PHSC3_001204 [Chlamydiales bacterium STE3]